MVQSQIITPKMNQVILAIYIGSKDIIIPNGVHQYEIVYKTRNQIGFYDNYDEIYWNVTGNEWDFPIQQVSCQVLFAQRC
jgi:hypothetical protein